MNHTKEFIDSINNKNTIKVTKAYLKNTPDDFDRISLAELQNFILSLKPKSSHDISNICSRIKAYALWLDKEGLVDENILLKNIQSVDRDHLWQEAKKTAESRLITNEEYRSILRKIRLSEEYNPLFYEVLFRSIYEGIYCDNLCVLENLRCSDIHGLEVTVRNNKDEVNKIKVSETLSKQLRELSKINVWYRPNLHGICEVDMVGLNIDSVFKAEERQGEVPRALRFTYYDKLRVIREQYVGHDLSPKSLYISGLAHRVNYLLKKNGITLEEAVLTNTRNKLAKNIITKELSRCNSVMRYDNFILNVRDYIELFEIENTSDISDDLFS